jgi:hypothetical protein
MQKWVIVAFIVVLVGAALATMIGAVWVYARSGGFSDAVSRGNQDWSAFGSYFGGMATAIVGFASVVILSITLLQQQSQMGHQSKNELKQDILSLIDKAEGKIDKLLQHEFAPVDGRPITLQEVVDGIRSMPELATPPYSSMIIRLFLLTGEYVESLMLYRDNVNPYFVYRFHRKRIEEIYAFLEKNGKCLDHWDRTVNLGILKELINRL